MTSSNKHTTAEELVEDYAAEFAADIKLENHRREQNRQYQTKLFEQLSEPFPVEMERTLVKGGTRLTYLPVSEVITRLNRIFGPLNWSFEIIKCERDTLDPEFIVAHVRLTVNGETGWSHVSKDGFGGQQIKRKKDGTIVDLGDEFKGAVSDALKKAAQQLGVGLYLARDPDAIEIDGAMHASEIVEQPAAPAMPQGYDQFMSLRSQLNEDQVQKLRSYWNDFSKGRPVPKPQEFTSNELDVLITECTRLLLDGEYTVPQSEDGENDGE